MGDGGVRGRAAGLKERGGLPGRGRDVILPGMSTLAEIEEAVPALSAEELDHLEARLREVRQQRALMDRRAPSDLSEFAGSLRLTEDPLAVQRRMREEWE